MHRLFCSSKKAAPDDQKMEVKPEDKILDPYSSVKTCESKVVSLAEKLHIDLYAAPSFPPSTYAKELLQFGLNTYEINELKEISPAEQKEISELIIEIETIALAVHNKLMKSPYIRTILLGKKKEEPLNATDENIILRIELDTSNYFYNERSEKETRYQNEFGVEKYRKVMASDPASSRIREICWSRQHLLEQCALFKCLIKDFKGAKKLYDELFRFKTYKDHEHNFGHYHILIAFVNEALEDFEGALNSLNSAISSARDRATYEHNWHTVGGNLGRLADYFERRGDLYNAILTHEQAATEYNKIKNNGTFYCTSAGEHYTRAGWLRLSQSNMGKIDYEHAVTIFGLALDNLKHAKPGYYQEAIKAARAGHEKAKEVVANFEKFSTELANGTIAFNKGIEKLGHNESKEALVLFDEAIQKNSNNPLFCEKRADTKWSLDEFNGAYQDYHKSISLNPNNAYTLRMRGAAGFKLGKFSEALIDLDKSLALAPKVAFTLSYRGVVKIALNDFVGGIKDMQDSLLIEPNNSWISNELSLAQKKLHEIQAKAEEEKKHGESLASARKCFQQGLGKFHAENYKDAIIELQKSLKINEEAETYYYLGMAYASDNNVTDAISQFNKCLSDYYAELTAERRADIFYARAQLKERLQKTEGAEKDYETALREFSTHAKANNALRDLRVKIENQKRSQEAVNFNHQLSQIAIPGTVFKSTQVPANPVLSEAQKAQIEAIKNQYRAQKKTG